MPQLLLLPLPPPQEIAAHARSPIAEVRIMPARIEPFAPGLKFVEAPLRSDGFWLTVSA